MRLRSVTIGLCAGVLMPAVAMGFTSVFRSAFTEVGGSNPTGLAVGDFDNGDGSTPDAVDAVTCNAGSGGNELIGFVGFADGTISQQGPQIQLNSFPSGMIKGRFDGDAIDDLMIAKANDDTVVFLKGLGNSSFFADPGPTTTVGHGPVGMATADIDGDGKADLITANEGDGSSPGSMTVLRGNADGSFTLIQQEDPSDPTMTVDSLPTEPGTRAVAIGNIDADPGVDVLAANSRSNSISVFTSDGHDVFTPRGTLPTASAPDDLALVDLNGDGKLDLLVAAENADALTVQFGNGDRTFGDPHSYPVGTAPNRLLVADLTNDGILDVLVSNNRSGDLSLLVGTGGGAFAAARTFVADAQPEAIDVGDFNNDGFLDAVAATEGSDIGPTVAVLRNRNHGELHAVEDIHAGNGPTALAVGDVDDDGSVDLLVSSDGDKVIILSGTPNGLTPALPPLIAGGHTVGVVATDLNGDNRPDIAVVDADHDGVAIFLSQGGGRFPNLKFQQLTAPNPGAITVGDFDGNGRPDLAVTTVGADRTCQGGPNPGQACSQDAECIPGICSALGKAAVLIQQANGTFVEHDTQVEETPAGIAAIDANCDGKDDLLVANLASDTVSVLRSNGDGTFTSAQTLSGNSIGQRPIALAVADFNRDGTQDFAVTNTVAPGSQSNVHLFRGNCSGPFAVFTGQGGQVRAGELASAIVARDFTGDQIVDLLVVSQTANNVQLLRGKGDGTMVPVGSDSVSRMPIALAAADFDGDGRYDGLSANSDPSANNVSLLTNCSREEGCDPFGRKICQVDTPNAGASCFDDSACGGVVGACAPGPLGTTALRGDGNGDGIRSAADLVAVGAEVMDNDGFAVEDIGRNEPHSPAGVDANGDGRVDAQDRVAVAHRIFSGA
jgi:hypothetical protein